MKIGELYQYLDNRIPSSLSCDWDHDGLTVCKDTEKEVSGITIALDCTDEIIKKAKENKDNVILTHHPLIFQPISELTPNGLIQRRVLKLIENNISAMSFHTRLDAFKGGVNDILAKELGLCDVEPIGDEKIGRVGTLPQEMTNKEFATLFKTVTGAPYAEISPAKERVKRIALLGGAGKDEVELALRYHADLYLTGEVRYNDLCDAKDMGMSVMVGGHYYTEKLVTKVLANFVKEMDCHVTVHVEESYHPTVI